MRWPGRRGPRASRDRCASSASGPWSWTRATRMPCAATVMEAEPEVVVNQLTNLPDKINYRKPAETFGATNELRGTVGPALAGIAAEAGARRLITQSVCFFYASTGKRAHGEDDPLLDLPPEAPDVSGHRRLDCARALDRRDSRPRGGRSAVWLLLRPRGRLRPRRLRGRRRPAPPLPDRRRRHRDLLDGPRRGCRVGDGGRGRAGGAGHLQRLRRRARRARRSGCRPTRRRSAPSRRAASPSGWRSRIAGQAGGVVGHRLEGASNEKAKRELGWQPKYPSWRQGFREALG